MNLITNKNILYYESLINPCDPNMALWFPIENNKRFSMPTAFEI